MVATDIYLIDDLDVFDGLRMVSKDVVNLVERFVIKASPGASSVFLLIE